MTHTHTEKLLAALREALTRMTELSYRVSNDFWYEDWVTIQTTLPQAIAEVEADIAAEKPDDFYTNRETFVSTVFPLLKEHGKEISPRVEIIRRAKLIIEALGLPEGGGVAWDNSGWWVHTEKPMYKEHFWERSKWEKQSTYRTFELPKTALPPWPDDAKTSWITANTEEV